MMLIMGFSSHESTALSQCLMAFSSFAALLINLCINKNPFDRSNNIVDIQIVNIYQTERGGGGGRGGKEEDAWCLCNNKNNI